MIFVFDENAGNEELVIKGETYKYLIKVRRHAIGEKIAFRSFDHPEIMHTYTLRSLDGRQAGLSLHESVEYVIKAEKELHIGWCVIDNRSIEKVLPALNELGVARITFITCDRSQKNFKPDLKRFERIVQSSMQQSGRTEMMRFDTAKNIPTFIGQNQDAVVFDFCEKVFEGGGDIKTVLIGAEGGFSKKEREQLKMQQTFRLNTPLILRSETAAVAISSKILL